MNKKRVKIVCTILTAVMCSMLGGCGLIESTGLSEEEDELVAEYAAGVIMRYSADKKGGLGDLRPTPTLIPWVDPASVAPEEAEKEGQAEEENSPGDEMPMEEVEGREDATVAEPASSGTEGRNIASAIGIDGFDVTYKGYETVDMYPESSGDDLSFSMQSTPGHKLLVVHLNVINEEAQDKPCDVLSRNVKFRVLINGTNRVNEQMTILLNDLKSYNETIPGNGSADTVLVFEVEDQVVENIDNLSLVIVTSTGESVFALE